VIKPSAATPGLMKHRGRAVVFADSADMHAKVEDESLDVRPEDILVLKNCGPRGYPGMAEVGNMPIPTKLVKQGVTDMVRISDARMSGTAYGTVGCTRRPGGSRRQPGAGREWRHDRARRRASTPAPRG
jgi:dihydroxy-acid dehydratase